MVNKIFNTITISLIILIAIGVVGTFLSDYLVEINWFGDYMETRRTWDGEGTFEMEVWGARHYWYNWGVFFLFITALARAVVNVISIIENSKK